MSSPVSPETHKTYEVYDYADGVKLYKFIGTLIQNASEGAKVPYALESYLRHAEANKHQVGTILRGNPLLVIVPASILFWVYRSCGAMNLVSPVHLPHVCKVATPSGEKFLITTKDEWIAHRDFTQSSFKPIQISDHAKLQYLTRVKNVDVDSLLSEFPINSLAGKGRKLEDGRTEYSVDDFLYVVDGNVCVTVLSKGMVTN